jgi:hypothetical protein
VCGRLTDRDGLKSVKVMGFVGVRHSTSENIARYWETGDPTGV